MVEVSVTKSWKKKSKGVTVEVWVPTQTKTKQRITRFGEKETGQVRTRIEYVCEETFRKEIVNPVYPKEII